MKISKNLIKKLTFSLSIVNIFTVIYLNLNKPEPVNAACGVATSSCLTCHEELGKNPINSKETGISNINSEIFIRPATKETLTKMT